VKLGPIVGLGSGFGAWTLAEYLTHRFPMHATRGSSSLADEHLDHHSAPLTTVKLAADAHNVAFKGGALVLGSLLVSVPFGTGFSAGYAGYTYLHDRIHHRAARSAMAQRVWQHHHLHHQGGPATNFGVTTPVWDVVFRTRRRVATVAP
jgi:dihydroceramide fatty acyl 2-hydroxylase